MFELLFAVALLSWAVVACLEYLASLPAAPTLAAAASVLPFLAVWRVRRLAGRGHLAFLATRRRPLPPEKFYWSRTRRNLGRRMAWSGIATVSAWPPALAWPAQTVPDTASVAGWIFAAIAIAATAETLAAAWLYVRASHRVDRLAPRALGWLRVSLYRLSDNHEFLGEEPLPRRKKARESVY